MALAWNDSDDSDGIRPSEVMMKIRRDDGKYVSFVHVDAKSDWEGWVSVYAPTGKRAIDVYQLSVVHNEVITGEDTITTYADDVRPDGVVGFAVTLTHTRNLYTVQGSVAWSDEGDNNSTWRSTIRLARDACLAAYG